MLKPVVFPEDGPERIQVLEGFRTRRVCRECGLAWLATCATCDKEKKEDGA